MPNQGLNILSSSPEETFNFGAKLAAILEPGDVIALTGDLGSGKTWLTKGIAAGLGIDENEVTSPSFTIINEYTGRLPLYHMDFYRLGGQCDSADLGIEEYFFGNGVTVIEWPEYLPEILPSERLNISIHIAGETQRTLSLSPKNEKWTERLAKLLKNL